MVETSTCLETTQQEMTNFTVRYRSNRTGPCSAAPLSVQSSYRYQNILRIGRSWGIVSMLKSLQKQLQRRHKQQCLKIHTLFRILMFFGRPFIASSANRKQCAGVIFGTPGTTYLSYSLVVSPNVYAVFPPRLSVRIYLSSDDC